MLYVFFSVFLLFGSALQYLTVDATGDVVFEIIRNIMLVFFVMDMIVRCVTDQDYFVCKNAFPTKASSSSGMMMISRSHATRGGSVNDSLAYMDDNLKDHEPCAIGSFLFWCDLISTMAILYDLSYINPTATGTRQVDIELNDDGIPVRHYLQLHSTLYRFGFGPPHTPILHCLSMQRFPALTRTIAFDQWKSSSICWW
jgi:hypothetical protein